MTIRASLVAAFLLAFSAQGSVAADWPSKPIHLVVPFGAGGAADVVARLFGDALSAHLHQPFIIENRAGGGGQIGAQSIIHAAPDGYTLLIGGMSPHVLSPAANKSPTYDPMADFTHIAYLGGAPSIILVHPSTGVKTFKEFLAYIRANPGTQYVSAGPGTVGNILTEYLAAKEQLKLMHVPYRSSGPAVVDLLAGRVKVGTLNWSTARPHVAAGKLVALAVSSAKRLADRPDLATLDELGYPDMVTATWHMLSGPAGIPKDVVDRLNREVTAIVKEPQMRKHLEDGAMESRVMTPSELTQYVRDEIAKWGPIARAVATAK
jgi:tripartite-type tricarboxylate transporter receptor subunit TctC